MHSKAIMISIVTGILFISAMARAETFLWTDNYFMTKYEYISYTEDRPAGRVYTAEIKNKLKSIDAVAYYSHHERFGLTDSSFGVDIYSTLGNKRWGNIAFETSPDPDFLPRWKASAFIYQGFKGFELSLGYKRIDSENVFIDIIVPGFIIYLPHNFYIVEQTNIVPKQGAVTVVLKLNYVANMKWRAYAGFSTGKVGEQISSEEELQKISTSSYNAGIEYKYNKNWSIGSHLYATYREDLYDDNGISMFISYWWGK